jgi:maltooligosyltrehalose trehalohydrolase
LGRYRRPRRAATLLDASAPATFRAAVLDWTRPLQSPHSEWLEYYRTLLEIRMHEIVPRVPRIKRASAGGSGPLLVVRWSASDGSRLALDANLSAAPVRAPPGASGRVLFATPQAAAALGPEHELPPWAVTWRLETDDVGPGS